MCVHLLSRLKNIFWVEEGVPQGSMFLIEALHNLLTLGTGVIIWDMLNKSISQTKIIRNTEKNIVQKIILISFFFPFQF